MNINFDNHVSPAIVANRQPVQGPTTAHVAGGEASSVHSLTITNATAGPEEIAAAKVPEEALGRDDPLGKLLNMAFNLPPPPMPPFA